MARFFQHIDQNDEKFQEVTELEMIDNTDPEFTMYYFKDGTRCTREFIGGVNSTDEIFGIKAFAEITSPMNKWEFKKRELTENVQYAVTKSGQKVEIADRYMIDHQNEIGKTSYYITKRPNQIPGFTPEADDVYMAMPDMTSSASQPSMASTQPQQFTQPVPEVKPVQQPQQQVHYSQDTTVIDEAVTSDIPMHNDKPVTSAVTEPNYVTIDAYNLIKNNKLVNFVYNGIPYSIPAAEFFEHATSKPKIVEKEVVKEVIVNRDCSDMHLPIDLDDNQKGLIDNMIDMSQKEKCDIDMEITLSLPPVSVYKIIKQVYPAGMAKAFVNIIADRMQIFELKSSVAAGLLAYYDEDASIEIAHETEETPTEMATVTEAVVTEAIEEKPKVKAAKKEAKKPTTAVKKPTAKKANK